MVNFKLGLKLKIKTLKQKIGTITQSQRIYVQLPVSVFSLMAFFFFKDCFDVNHFKNLY